MTKYHSAPQTTKHEGSRHHARVLHDIYSLQLSCVLLCCEPFLAVLQYAIHFRSTSVRGLGGAVSQEAMYKAAVQSVTRRYRSRSAPDHVINEANRLGCARAQRAGRDGVYADLKLAASLKSQHPCVTLQCSLCTAHTSTIAWICKVTSHPAAVMQVLK